MSIMGFVSEALDNCTALSMGWHFEPWKLYGNDRSQSEERFPLTNRVECALREGYQNLLDCGATKVWIRFFKVPFEQLDKAFAIGELAARGRECSEPFDLVQDDEGMVTCMEIRDNGRGIGGVFTVGASRPKVKPNPFQSYLFGVGNSAKENGNGSKGVGRTGIMALSTLRVVAVVTKRRPQDGGETIAFGFSELDLHTYGDKDFKAPGRFVIAPAGEEGILIPAQGGQAVEFAAGLGIDWDDDMVGTSQVYPSLREEVTPEAVISEIVLRHFIPHLTGRIVTYVQLLEGTVVTIDKDSILELAGLPEHGGSSSHREAVATVARLLDAAKSPRDVGRVEERLEGHSFPEEVLEELSAQLEEGLPVAVRAEHALRQRARGDLKPVSGHLVHAVVENPALSSGMSILMRDDIVKVSNGRSGTVRITIAKDEAAKMLRDGEDNSHVKWVVSKMTDRGWPLAAAGHVAHDFQYGARALHDLLTGNTEEVENRALALHFGVPSPDSRKKALRGTGHGGKPEPDVDREKSSKPHTGSRTNFEREPVPPDAEGLWGVKLTYAEMAKERLPEAGKQHLIAFAYHQAEGHLKWDDHSTADFDLRDCVFVTRGCSVRVVEPNVLSVGVQSPDFSIVVRGPFHPDRMIRVAEVVVDGNKGE